MLRLFDYYTTPTTLPAPGSYNFEHLSKEAYAALEKEALNAEKSVKQNHFVLTGFKNPQKPDIAIISCQGDGGKDQQAVADLLEEVAVKRAPDAIFCSGDILYKYGALSPLSDFFTKCFYSVYKKLNIPWILVGGNHDAARCALGTTNKLHGIEALAQEIAHSYVPDGIKYKSVNQLIDLYNSPQIALDKLNRFNMRKRYDSFDIGDTITVFMVDSNHIFKDYIEYMENIGGAQTDPTVPNQFKMLLEGIKKAKQLGKEVRIFQHHPLKTTGKRFYPNGYDYDHYLSDAEVEKICQYLQIPITKSYNELLYHLYKKYYFIGKPEHPNEKKTKLYPAHDHFISIDENEEFFQLTMGAGGGKLQDCETLTRYPNMKLHLRRHGFAREYDGNIDIHTTSELCLMSKPANRFKMHLRYDLAETKFVCLPHRDERVDKLRELIQRLSDQFLLELKNLETGKSKESPVSQPKEEKSSYYYTMFQDAVKNATKMIHSAVKYFTTDESIEECFCINDMKAYFNQYELKDLKSCLEYLLEVQKKFEAVEKIRKPKEAEPKNSFSEKIKSEFNKMFGLSLKDLYDNETMPITRNMGLTLGSPESL